MNNNDHPAQRGKGDQIRSNLTNVFQEYTNKEVPKELKKEVFSTLASIELAANVLDLFTVKFIRSEAEFLSEIVDQDKRNEKKSPEM